MAAQLTAIAYEVPGRKHCLRTFWELDASALDANSTSGWAHVAMLGSWEGHSRGSFKFTAETFAQILKNFSAQRNPIPWDYEHDTFNFDTTGPKPASGWVRELELRNNGTELWAYVDWTPRAAQMIRDGEYRYCSPVVDFDSVDRRTKKSIGAELLSVALTNNPFLDGQHPLTLTWVAAAMTPEEEERRKQEQLAQQHAQMAAQQSAVSQGPPQQDQQPQPPNANEDQKAMAEPPPPPPPAANDPSAADAAMGDGSEADANALINALADASGLDKAQTLAALMDIKDLLVNKIQETVQRDGTPAEATRRTMSTDKKDTPAQQAAAPQAATSTSTTQAAAGAIGAMTLDELERTRDKETIATLTARLEKIEAEREEEKKGAIAALVDQKIADGYIPPEQRDTAIWAFTTDRKRAEQIYANKLIPIGSRQSMTPPSAAAGTGGAPAAPQHQVIDMSMFSRQELLTIDCLMGARKSRDEAIAIVMKRRGAVN